MLIRKLYKFEAGHVVRDCNSRHCRKNQHGHSYKVEVFFESKILTKYGMIIDFGDLKQVKEFIDRFDHAYHFWNKESNEFKNFHRKYDERNIELPFNPTAENYAIYFLKAIKEILKKAKYDNKEAKCVAVRVHETDTGYAEATIKDLPLHKYYNLKDIKFSDGIFNS